MVGAGLAIVPVAPSPASANRGDVTTFTDVEGEIDRPTDLAVAPDGLVWFTSQGNDRIGRLDPDTGDITTFGVGANPGTIDQPRHLTVGADGNVWFTNLGNDFIGRLNADTGVVNVYPGASRPTELVLGPDGHVWFAGDEIGRITTRGVVTTYAEPAKQIVAGGDDRLWFLSPDDRIGSIDASGVPVFTTATVVGATDLAVDAGGNLWISSYPPDGGATADAKVHVFDPATQTVSSGTFAARGPGPGSQPSLPIAGGPDLSVWFVNGGSSQLGTSPIVGRVDAVGLRRSVWNAPGVERNTATAIAPGVDGDIWFASARDDLIGRVDARGGDVAIRKSVDEEEVVVGDVLHYHLDVINTGTQTLTNVSITDANAPDCSGPLDDLPAGTSVRIDCSYTTTNMGVRTNSATVHVNEAASHTSNGVSTAVLASPTTHPAASISLEGRDLGVVAGEDIRYDVTIENTGDVPLTQVVVSDGSVPDCARPLTDLTPGEERTFACSFTTSAANVGTYLNRATVDAAEITSSPSNVVAVQVGLQRSVTVTQTADAPSVAAGDLIGYHVTVTNTGDIPLGHVAVIDGPDSPLTSDLGTLAPDDQVTIDRSLATTVGDLGTFTNIATVIADRLDPVSADPLEVEVTIPPAGFSDVAPSAFYADGVDWAALFGVLGGSADGRFRPGDRITRSRMVSALFEMMDAPEGSPHHPFDDVRDSAPYRPAVDWAVEEGLVSGSRPRFDPRGSVSRADLVKLVWRMVGAPADAPDHPFTDVSSDARYGAALDWAAANLLVDAFAPGPRFKPDRSVNRGQVAYLLHRLALTEGAWPQGPDDPAPPSTVLF